MTLDDRLLAALAEFGPQTTGALRNMTGPHFTTRHLNHGRQGLSGRWIVCVSCNCVETIEVSDWAGPTVRAALKRLARQGKVIRLDVDQPNNHGGHGWMLTGWPLEVEGEVSVLVAIPGKRET